MIDMSEQRWAEAGAQFEEAMRLSADEGLPLNYRLLADVFARAGDSGKAAMYGRRAAMHE